MTSLSPKRRSNVRKAYNDWCVGVGGMLGYVITFLFHLSNFTPNRIFPLQQHTPRSEAKPGARILVHERGVLGTPPFGGGVVSLSD